VSKKNPIFRRYPRPDSRRKFAPRIDPRKIGNKSDLLSQAVIETLAPKTPLHPPRTAIVTTIFPPEEMFKPWLMMHFYRSHPKILDSLFAYLLKSNPSGGSPDGFPLYSEHAVAAGLPKFVSGPIRVVIDEINCFTPAQEHFGSEQNMSPQSIARARLTDTHCLMFPENINTPSPTLPGQVVEINYTEVNGASWAGGLFGQVVQEKPIPGYDNVNTGTGKSFFDRTVNDVKTSLVEPDAAKGHRVKISQDMSDIINDFET